MDLGAQDFVTRLTELQRIRSSHEQVWHRISEVAAPDSGRFQYTGLNQSQNYALGFQALASQRSAKIYDSTAVNAIDRLASGIEALIVPQSDYWHDLGVMDLTHERSTDEERQWLERLRNVLFKVRYDADSGWKAAVQTCIRRCVAFGNAFMFVEDGTDSRALIRYRALPLEECFVSENHAGVIDTFYRPYLLTARQALQKFGARCPKQIAAAAQHATDKDRQFMFIHAIQPRAEVGMLPGVHGAPFSSTHISMEDQSIVGTSGYFEFPIIDFRWLPEMGATYGEGPVQKCLADIQSLNLMARNELIASQQAVDPPLLVANAGIMNRPNTNPGAINFGGMAPNGQKLIEPMMTGQRLDFATLVREAKANQVKESLYVNLFAILTSPNPTYQSATEALIKANEKADMLGPVGGRLQQSLSNLVERELGVLERKGIYRPDSAYRIPRSLRGKNIGPQFTSPLDKMRRNAEATGTVRFFEILTPLMTINPAVADHVNTDEMSRGLADVLGLPARFLQPAEVVQQIRVERAQQMQAAQMAEMLKTSAQGAKAGAEALQTLRPAA
jgi:hypothetical protein